ncbi:MAG: DUF5398 family protein [Chlamydiia bacterium]|nr:DUF5398 family protein [Chlamydiia bacterium]MCP5509235.1 DUF5398 family protein [Chlamydiales bacterium]
MYGLEKRPKDAFEFDLEKELKSDPKRRKELMDMSENAINELKAGLRKEDPKSEDFEKYGILLHGFTAFQTVASKVK